MAQGQENAVGNAGCRVPYIEFTNYGVLRGAALALRNRDLLGLRLLLFRQLQLESKREDAVFQLGNRIAFDVLRQAKLPLEGAVRQLADVVLIVALLAIRTECRPGCWPSWLPPVP